MGGDGIQEDQYLKTAGADADNSYATVMAVNVATLAEGKQFIADYKAAFNDDPGAYSASAFDATNIIIQAIKTAGKKDREAVRAAIAATKDYKGVRHHRFRRERRHHQPLGFDLPGQGRKMGVYRPAAL